MTHETEKGLTCSECGRDTVMLVSGKCGMCPPTTPLPDGGDVEADTVAFVQEWMMSGDHEADQWHRDFAAAIDARAAMPNRAPAGEAVAYAPKGHIERYLKGRNTACWVYGSPTADDNTPLYATPPAPKDGEVERLREALSKVRDQFQFYTDEHKTKADAAKKAWDDACYWSNVAEQEQTRAEFRKRHQQMETNAAFVRMIDAALNEREG